MNRRLRREMVVWFLLTPVMWFIMLLCAVLEQPYWYKKEKEFKVNLSDT